MAERNERRGGGLGPLKAWSEASGRFPGGSMLVDIVLVIDGTASMQDLLDEVKDRALSLYGEIVDRSENHRFRIKKLRIKVLIFRDVYVDTNAFEESGFFTLPEEAEKLHAFMEQVRAAGGGDEPESGLEALHKAIHAEWQQILTGNKARQIIIVMTDASAHRLDDPQRDGDDLYPKDVPWSLSGLEDEWLNPAYTSPMNHRMLVMAPNSWPWKELGLWYESLFMPTEAGCGISKAGMDAVINFISGSIS